MSRSPRRSRRRSAAAAVELAFVLPFLVILILGLWEMGRLVQVQQILNNAAREGVRLAAQSRTINATGSPTDIKLNTGTPNVEQTVKNYLREAGIDSTGVVVTFAFTNGDTTLTEPWQGVKGQQFKVHVTLPFSNVRWTVLQLAGTTTLRAKADWTTLVDDPFSIDTTLPNW